MKRLTLLVIVLFSIIACRPQQRLPEPPVNDHASVKIAEAADAVSTSIVELARIEAAATPPNKNTHLPDPRTYGIKQVASVDWSGPIGPLVKKMGEAISYRVRVLGPEPAVPIIITLATHNAPVANILRDVDFQAGTKAYVRVYPRQKTIELRYARI